MAKESVLRQEILKCNLVQCHITNKDQPHLQPLLFHKEAQSVNNSRFTFNDYPALGSGANQLVSAIITNNYIEGNNISNGNRPQLNMGPSGADTLRIVGNTIKGNRALTRTGGISSSSLLGITNRARIENNIITDNRYGINFQGATSSGIIKGNIIENNNTENNPNLGGSGIWVSARCGKSDYECYYQ